MLENSLKNLAQIGGMLIFIVMVLTGNKSLFIPIVLCLIVYTIVSLFPSKNSTQLKLEEEKVRLNHQASEKFINNAQQLIKNKQDAELFHEIVSEYYKSIKL